MQRGVGGVRGGSFRRYFFQAMSTNVISSRLLRKIAAYHKEKGNAEDLKNTVELMMQNERQKQKNRKFRNKIIKRIDAEKRAIAK